ncbi:MAG: hypothetical protein KBT58_09155 [Bizionia sp.]|nr:hypothetical protein [Bizionia sp.]
MTDREVYFRISKNGHIHTLSDRISFNWKELLMWTFTSFLFLIWLLGIGIGIFIAILTLMGYIIYRFASWIYYSELKIDEKSGKLTRLKKILDRTQKTELINEKFDPNRFEYTELTRSGKTKFLLSYRTHKNNELLIIRNKTDKEQIEKYIAEKIIIYNNV